MPGGFEPVHELAGAADRDRQVGGDVEHPAGRHPGDHLHGLEPRQREVEVRPQRASTAFHNSVSRRTNSLKRPASSTPQKVPLPADRSGHDAGGFQTPVEGGNCRSAGVRRFPRRRPWRHPPKPNAVQSAVSFRPASTDCPGRRSTPGWWWRSGVAWILDGLEITVASAVADTLSQPETLGLSSTAVGFLATVYLAGEVVGALFFGRLSDKLGRRNLFMVTLGVYLVGSGLTALTLGNGVGGWVVFLYVTRFIAGWASGGRVRRHQLGDRRVDPPLVTGGVGSTLRSTEHIGRGGDTRHPRYIRLPQVHGPEPGGVAARVPDRPPCWGLVILVLRRHLPRVPPAGRS